jgi:hypothetical protein
MREVGPNVQAHRLDDNCWWEVRLAAIPTRVVNYPAPKGQTRQYVVPADFTDVVKGAKLSKPPPEELYGKPGVYAAGKRQLSRKEIAALALNR